MGLTAKSTLMVILPVAALASLLLLMVIWKSGERVLLVQKQAEPASNAAGQGDAPAAPPPIDSPRATPRADPRSWDVSNSDEGEYVRPRALMVERQLRARDIRDENILQAMNRVPRHVFVPERLRDMAYTDQPLPIGHQQTISQPYIVALMTQLAQPRPESRALDVGTGSGYQAAVLGELVEKVYSIEILEPLADEARTRLASLRYENVEVRRGDGYAGWPEHAPFDLIIVAAAPHEIPQPLIDQLAPGGRLVIPVGELFQDLMVVEKHADGTVDRRKAAPVAFVPMTRENNVRENLDTQSAD
jgi:protein-L-isoaspartate(D-aspartate) O-methyltransferase